MDALIEIASILKTTFLTSPSIASISLVIVKLAEFAFASKSTERMFAVDSGFVVKSVP